MWSTVFILVSFKWVHRILKLKPKNLLMSQYWDCDFQLSVFWTVPSSSRTETVGLKLKKWESHQQKILGWSSISSAYKPGSLTIRSLFPTDFGECLRIPKSGWSAPGQCGLWYWRERLCVWNQHPRWGVPSRVLGRKETMEFWSLYKPGGGK